ncbi:MAG: hydroxyacylglutathione hydrolase [Pseudomonadota bacterium]
MPLDVVQFPCLQDNYGYLIHDPETGAVAAIDTPDVEAINNALAERGWRLTTILNTHHHFDHAGGNLALKEQWGCEIIGPRGEQQRIPGLDRAVGTGDRVSVGNRTAAVLDTPGHTAGHIVYHFKDDDAAFVGDTIFALGCGRLFEGTPAQMLTSLSAIAAWPAETKLYCAHEYTLANGTFAQTVDPDNAALKTRMVEIEKKRADNIPTVPTTVGLERATNPFLRAGDPILRAGMGMDDATDVDVFAEVRRRKDQF